MLPLQWVICGKPTSDILLHILLSYPPLTSPLFQTPWEHLLDADGIDYFERRQTEYYPQPPLAKHSHHQRQSYSAPATSTSRLVSSGPVVGVMTSVREQ